MGPTSPRSDTFPDGDYHAVVPRDSFSKKYEQYNSYDVMPTGEGVWGVILERKTPMRMTHEELSSHSLWKNFSSLMDAQGLEHLPVCRRVIAGHGGRIWVESQMGQGSACFFMPPISGGKVSWKSMIGGPLSWLIADSCLTRSGSDQAFSLHTGVSSAWFPTFWYLNVLL